MIADHLIRSLVIVSATCLSYYAYKLFHIVNRIRRLGRTVDQFPMDKKHWFKGHAHKMVGTGEETISYLMQLMKKYPKACGLYLTCLRPYILVHHPDTVKTVVKKQGEKPKVLGMYRYGKPWFGESLAMSSGKQWLRNRRVLTPAFHFDSLKKFVTIKNEATDLFLNNLAQLAESNSSFEINGVAAPLTFDIILRCAFSYHSGVQTTKKDHFYIKALDELPMLWMKRQYNPLHHFDCIYWRTEDGKTFDRHCKTANDLANSLIKERRKLIAEDSVKAETYHDFMNILMKSKDEDSNGLSDDEIRDEINTFICAGYETTASAISWTLYSMAIHPEYQKRCQKEVDDLMKGRPDDHFKWNDLEDIPFLTMCIKESLRLYGPPLIERELDEETLIDGKLVPPGTTVMICLYNHHRNPAVWEDPMTFNPERFSTDRIQSLDPFAFVPFSAGPRNCIGQSFALEELKIVLARSMRRFFFTAKENHIPNMKLALTLKSENGIYLKATERHVEINH